MLATLQVQEEAEGSEDLIPDATVPSRRIKGKMSIRFLELEEESVIERLAQAALMDDAFTDDTALSILEAWTQEEEGSKDRRGEFEGKAVFGTYCHGGNRGITNRTLKHQNTAKFLNKFLMKSLSMTAKDEDLRWNSLMFLRANEVPVHRDYRNEWDSAKHLVQIPGDVKLRVDDEFVMKKGTQPLREEPWTTMQWQA